VLFSEPKILNLNVALARLGEPEFQCSSASRKFSIFDERRFIDDHQYVSVLFSEPKILNRAVRRPRAPRRASFSALQRAENSQF